MKIDKMKDILFKKVTESILEKGYYNFINLVTLTKVPARRGKIWNNRTNQWVENKRKYRIKARIMPKLKEWINNNQ